MSGAEIAQIIVSLATLITAAGGVTIGIIMLIWFVWSLPFNTWAASAPYAGNVLLFILFLLLGWHAFGAPVHG